MTIAELNQDRINGLIKSSTYIRMAIALTKGNRPYGEEYALDLNAIPGVSEAEKFMQLLQMSGDKLIEINGAINNDFSVTWSAAANLPTYSKQQISEWKNGGLLRKRGLLYFAMAADNPSKATNQLISITNLRNYGFNDEDIFAELAELSAQKLLITGLSTILIRWIEPSDRTTSGDDQRFTAIQSQIDSILSQLESATNSEEIDTLEDSLAAALAEMENLKQKDIFLENKINEEVLTLNNKTSELETSIQNLPIQILESEIANQAALINELQISDDLQDTAIASLRNDLDAIPTYSPEVVTFLEASLLNGWKRYEVVEGGISLYGNPLIIKNGPEISLSGLIEQGSIGLMQPCLILPEGQRPNRRLTFSVFSSDIQGFPEVAYLEVRPNGEVIPLRGNNAAFGLDGVRFTTGEVSSAPTPAPDPNSGPSDNPGSRVLISREATASASISDTEFPANNANDGNPSTRWATSPRNGIWEDNEWIQLRFPGTYSINRVNLEWEFAHASSYKIQGSLDGENWFEIMNVTGQNGGTNDLTFPAQTTRYVRMQGISRGTEYGYSLFNFEVYSA